LLELVSVIVVVILLSLALCLFLLLRRRRLHRSYNQDQGSNTSFFGLSNGKAKKSLVLPFTVKKARSPSNISHSPENGKTGNAPPPHQFSGQEVTFRSDSSLIPTVTPVESPNEATMTSETPFQSSHDVDVSYPPEKVEARVAEEADLHVEQEIAPRPSPLVDAHLSAEASEEILALRQLVEDMMHTMRARDMRFSGLTLGTSGTLDEPPPQYQPG
jgi:hypothetical protein